MARRPGTVCRHPRGRAGGRPRRRARRSATPLRPANHRAGRSPPVPVRNLLARWDTFWYLDIAPRGYHWNGNPLEQQNVVFFPLYPLLMRAGGVVTGGHPLLAGLVDLARRVPDRAVLLLAVDRRQAGTGHGDDGGVAAQRVPVRDLLQRGLHRVAVSPAGDRRLLLRRATPVRALGDGRRAGRAGPTQRPAAVDPDRVDRARGRP